MENIVQAVALCVFLAGCSAVTGPDEGMTRIERSGVQGVIFPATRATVSTPRTAWQDLAVWTPSKADITSAMPDIVAFLKKTAPVIAGRLSKYRCQYFGTIVGEKKRIYCNFFHRDGLTDSWTSEPVMVLGGGDWYFRLEYDVESRQCFQFGMNAEL